MTSLQLRTPKKLGPFDITLYAFGTRKNQRNLWTCNNQKGALGIRHHQIKAFSGHAIIRVDSDGPELNVPEYHHNGQTKLNFGQRVGLFGIT